MRSLDIQILLVDGANQLKKKVLVLQEVLHGDTIITILPVRHLFVHLQPEVLRIEQPLFIMKIVLLSSILSMGQMLPPFQLDKKIEFQKVIFGLIHLELLPQIIRMSIEQTLHSAKVIRLILDTLQQALAYGLRLYIM